MKLTLLLISILLLSSCTIDWNGEKDTKIAELEKQMQDDTFKKKQECNKEFNSLRNTIISLEKWGSNEKSKSLQEIFYSNKTKSCLYVYRSDDINGDYSKFQLELGQDPANGIGGESCYFSSKNSDYSGCKAFDDKIQKLKGE